MALILQTKRRYDGFTLLEEYQVCGLCGARVDAAKDVMEPSDPLNLSPAAGSAGEKGRRPELAGLGKPPSGVHADRKSVV